MMPGYLRFGVWLLAGLAAIPAWAQQTSLANGPGKETVEAACVLCHSLSYIEMNAKFLGPDIWKAEVAKMRTAFGAPIDDAAAAEIAAYLVSRYGVAKP